MTTNERGASRPGVLEGHWRFDQLAANVTPDASGSGLDGKLIAGATLVPEDNGRVLRLDGRGQYVLLGNPVPLRLTGSLSISAWIKSSAFPLDDAAIVSSHSGLGYQLDTTVDEGPRTVGFKLADSSGRLMARYGKTPLVLDTWYHLAGVYDAPRQALHVYLNGEPDDGCLVGEVSVRQQASGQNVYIGRRANRRGFEFAGLIDDVHIYSRALTGREVRDDMYQTANAGSRLTRSRAGNRPLPKPDGVAGTATGCKPFRVSVDRTALGSIVFFGLLVAIAVVGYFPAAGWWMPVLASTAAGLVLLFRNHPAVRPSLDGSATEPLRWPLTGPGAAAGQLACARSEPHHDIPIARLPTHAGVVRHHKQNATAVYDGVADQVERAGRQPGQEWQRQPDRSLGAHPWRGGQGPREGERVGARSLREQTHTRLTEARGRSQSRPRPPGDRDSRLGPRVEGPQHRFAILAWEHGPQGVRRRMPGESERMRIDAGQNPGGRQATGVGDPQHGRPGRTGGGLVVKLEAKRECYVEQSVRPEGHSWPLPRPGALAQLGWRGRDDRDRSLVERCWFAKRVADLAQPNDAQADSLWRLASQECHVDKAVAKEIAVTGNAERPDWGWLQQGASIERRLGTVWLSGTYHPHQSVGLRHQQASVRERGKLRWRVNVTCHDVGDEGEDRRRH